MNRFDIKLKELTACSEIIKELEESENKGFVCPRMELSLLRGSSCTRLKRRVKYPARRIDKISLIWYYTNIGRGTS